MKFGLFLALNALILIRPEELFPAITGIRLYLITISLCTLLSLPDLIETLSLDSLRRRPITVCVHLDFCLTILSLCVLGRVSEAFFEFGPEFAKVILYYLLLISIVDDSSKFRTFVIFLLIMVVILTSIALAQQYSIVSFPNIQPAMQREFNSETGEEFILSRLCSSGIFSDPNDLCLMLGLGILCCVYASTSGSGLVGRVVWLFPIPIFIFALFETHSRGGMLGALAGGAAYLFSRFGGPKSLPIVFVGGLATLTAVGGRQGSLEGGGTAHQRVIMWADGLRDLFSRPFYLLTGLGDGWFLDEYSLVAHNSFVHAYVESGILGGGAFLLAFVYGIWITYRLGQGIEAPYWALKARPFAFSVLVAYATGCYSISRNQVIPTYITLGLISVVLNSTSLSLPDKFRVDRRWFFWYFMFAISGLVLIKFATQGLGLAGV